eukprot:CAMPEP_0196142290 /NCGR_PEP_ID=MMETSP0910-20130528/11502_1 /TAXON_ID=49265 /ORGANISM="Thalassiosira rotula, Strain GSO102" /LENGTH=101 /DNA_ID=CAMNT_0041403587 /DNA_START=372 /DNA_END=677 /DNA_ORIENTATION=+
MTKHNKVAERKHGKKHKNPPPKEKKKESAEDRKKSFAIHDHCHKVQKAPSSSRLSQVKAKPSKYDELGAMLAAEEMAHKKERQHHHIRQHHREMNQPAMTH